MLLGEPSEGFSSRPNVAGMKVDHWPFQTWPQEGVKLEGTVGVERVRRKPENLVSCP